MSEENNSLPAGEQPKRTVRMKLDGKFGVSEERPDRGYDRGPDSRVAGDRKSFDAKRSSDYRDRSPYGDRPQPNDRPAFGERAPREGGFRNDRPGYGDRPQHGAPREGGFRNDRPSYGDRPQHGAPREGGFRNDRPSYGDRPQRSAPREGGFRNDRPSYGDRPQRSDRPAFGGSHPRFSPRDDHHGERKVWNEQGGYPGAPVFRQRPTGDVTEFPEDVLPPASPEMAEEAASEKDPPWFRKLLALTTEKGREREEKFLAEGVRVVAEMIQYHADIVNGIYIVEGFMDEALFEKARAASIRIHDLTTEQMAKLSTTVTGPGVVAICRCASRKPDYDCGHVITLVDAVQDPGNLGSLFRTSLGFDSDGMLLGKGTVNPFNPKVVRGSSGTFLRVPFEHGVDLLERIQFLRQKGYCIIATDLHAKQSIADISPRKLRKVAIIMGNEGAGAEKGLIEQADELVRIPMSQSLESLNVAVAHGILSYQLAQMQEKA
jgi:tRNA G18 (ribose-2'-O)-methylase SpoU